MPKQPNCKILTERREERERIPRACIREFNGMETVRWNQVSINNAHCVMQPINHSDYRIFIALTINP